MLTTSTLGCHDRRGKTEASFRRLIWRTTGFWWNRDFLALMGQRWGLENVNTVLYVGCGLGHWGQTLIDILPTSAQVTGIDREPKWVEAAQERVQALNLADRFSYQTSVASELPFAGASFDVVTCQTVLIHVQHPIAVLREMLRVLKSGGLLVVAEPNNLVSSLVFNSVKFEDSIERICDRDRFQLVCERGKAALADGNNSIGDLLPGYFAEVGLKNIQVYLSDKAATLFLPYPFKAQQVFRQQNSRGLKSTAHSSSPLKWTEIFAYCVFSPLEWT